MLNVFRWCYKQNKLQENPMQSAGTAWHTSDDAVVEEQETHKKFCVLNALCNLDKIQCYKRDRKNVYSLDLHS